MKAIVCEAWGTPESLQLKEIPSPIPGPNQLLIRTQIASVNFPDTLVIAGKYQFKPALPFVPGGELAGTVLAVGEQVKGFEAGDAVVAVSLSGGFAEEAAVDASMATRLPDGFSTDDFQIAGSMMMTYGTSLHALKDRAQARAGERLLVLGAAGGVGLAAVEIGKQLGMQVIAAASSDSKLAVAKAHGADELINYASENLRERIKSLTQGAGVDVVYDPVGGDFTEQALRSLAWGGRHLVVGFAAGNIPAIPVNLMLLKGSALVGVFWGEFIRRQPEAHAANMDLLFGWLREGKIKPRISARYALSEVADALNALQTRQVIGKVVVVPTR